MKSWFWNYKIPATLRDNPDEPWVEMHREAPNEKGWNAYLDKKPLAKWGLELVKMDVGWGTEDSWEPHPDLWPHGMRRGEKKPTPRVCASAFGCPPLQGRGFTNSRR